MSGLKNNWRVSTIDEEEKSGHVLTSLSSTRFATNIREVKDKNKLAIMIKAASHKQKNSSNLIMTDWFLLVSLIKR